MSLPATIQTAISPDAISRASRLFSGSALDALHELLQNARRAGATRIAVDLAEQDGQSWLCIRDDGCGVDDPASLLTLGHSGWDDAVARSEDPAGMGLFSLAGRTVNIQSWSPAAGEAWQVTIPADAWDTPKPLALRPSILGWGTQISLSLPDDWKAGLRHAVATATLFYPLPVTMGRRPRHPPGFPEGRGPCRGGLRLPHRRL